MDNGENQTPNKVNKAVILPKTLKKLNKTEEIPVAKKGDRFFLS